MKTEKSSAFSYIDPSLPRYSGNVLKIDFAFSSCYSVLSVCRTDKLFCFHVMYDSSFSGLMILHVSLFLRTILLSKNSDLSSLEFTYFCCEVHSDLGWIA